jgi:hypothetical protein
MIKCTKIEGKVIQEISRVILDPALIEIATKRINEKVKKRLSAAPEELRSLEKKLSESEKEIKNLLTFISSHGDSSVAVKTSLADKESEAAFYRDQIFSLKNANVDRLLLTQFALKAQFQRITELFNTNKTQANLAIRQMIPEGLACKAVGSTTKKNLNQNNSKWVISGTMLIHQTTESKGNGFVSPLSQELHVET